jgi:hypothetical protein
MDIAFTVDTSELNKVARRLSRLRENFPETLAKSMTYAAYDAQKELKKQTPAFVDNPTNWTTNSTFVQKASPSDLSVRLGFKDYASKGTAAAKYLEPMVAGKPRPAKSAERQLQRRGLLRSSEYLVPTGVTPLRLNSYGNLPGSTYTQVLSRIGGLGEQGYTANRSGSARSTAKRRQRDYFIGQPAGLPRAIYARLGRGQRGFHTAFYITEQPKYEQKFPVRSIVQAKFNTRFPSIFERIVFTGR